MNLIKDIKFRGITPTGKVVYGLPIKSNSETKMSMVISIYHVDCYEYNVDELTVFPESIAQYTGLKDKNGKEIYEHDILISDTFGNSHYFIVIYRSGTYRLKSTLNPGHQIMLESNYKFFKVVGNIYQNKELLK